MRLCCIALDIGGTKISLINGHAITEEKEEEIKDELYEGLDDAYKMKAGNY